MPTSNTKTDNQTTKSLRTEIEGGKYMAKETVRIRAVGDIRVDRALVVGRN